MLAGDGAAERHRELHHLAVRRLRALGHVRVGGVEDDQRVGVAVAGVGDDGDGDLALRGDVGDAVDQGAELRQRVRRRPRAAGCRCARRPGSRCGGRRRTPRPRRGRRWRRPRWRCCSSQSPAISSHSAAAWPAGSSDWMTSIAAASRSSPILVRSSTALMVGRSMNSSIEGRSRRVIASTVAVASSRVANVATRVAGGRCFGISRSTISVTMPSVPSRADEQLGQRQPGDVLEPRRRRAGPRCRRRARRSGRARSRW